MPELPDVELFKRDFDQKALGRRVERVKVNEARILAGVTPRQFQAALKGTRFESSRRHGKHLLVALDTRRWLTLHFGMTGSLQYFEDLADDPPYDRVRFDLTGGGRLAYVSVRMLGRVGLADDAEAFIAAEALGPDALHRRFDLAAFSAALAGRKKAVKAILMDQTSMAGIGNIYSDEILFQARVHPATQADHLSEEQIETLFAMTKEVLRTAIKRRAGSEQFLYRLPEEYLLPHREKGGQCPRCGAMIRTIKASGRTGYYCPRCQPKPKVGSYRSGTRTRRR